MSLSERCERAFTHSTRDKGLEYEEDGRVSVKASSLQRVTARVEGADDDYEVTVDWSDAANGVASLRCTCPHFRDGSMCKHLWATILASDAAGLTADIPQGGRLRLQRLEAGQVDEPETASLPASVLRQIADRVGQRLQDLESSKEDLWEENDFRTGPGQGRRPRRRSSPKAPPRPKWERAFDQIATINSEPTIDDADPVDVLREKGREATYALDLSGLKTSQKFLVHVYQRERKQSGEFGKLKPVKLDKVAIDSFPDVVDRRVLQMIFSECEPADYWSYGHRSYGYGSYGGRGNSHSFFVPRDSTLKVLKQLAETGRLVLVPDSSDEGVANGQPLAWEGEPAYRLRLAVGRDEAKKQWVISGRFDRGDGSPPVELDSLLTAHRAGVAMVPGRIIQIDCWGDFGWLMAIKDASEIRVPFAASQELRKRLWSMRSLPWIELPIELRGEERRIAPTGRLRVVPMAGAPRQLEVEVSLLYGSNAIPPFNPSAGVVDREGNVIVRDREAERGLLRRLSEMGISRADAYNPQSHRLKLAAAQLPQVVEGLTRDGWQVEAEGYRLKRPGEFKLSVSSTIEWFELDGGFDFDGEEVKLPALLAAVRKGEKYVTLGDGSRGLLPDEWLKRFGSLADLGETDKDTLRFQPSQALLLDALLSAQGQDRVKIDARFAETRQRLRSFEGIRPAEAPQSFQGQLRNYQKAGLGWLGFLREYRFGGCLADDMGLGKTVQVLALLESRRTDSNAKGPRKPSLAVVPKSLVFNWVDEAKRFAPDLRVVNYTGLERGDSLKNLEEIDLVVTTYGTLRRDILKLKEIAFEYAILDEAQAIKNAASQSAKACRLIQADHRLAMTGTPVENHLGELWSLFEFLNPGMLGRSAAFHSLSRRDNADDDSLKILSRALAPYLLRRTKQQVLTELPEKTEQTLYCDLEGDQRKQYNEIRDYYRAALSGKIADDGIGKSKIQILEALLRLRQAACHPGLLSEEHQGVESAKFEALLEQVAEIAEEGHKALVFSQFTSLLALLKPKLDERGLRYEYLDGRTRDRKEKVEKFQNDPKCPLFLISLKAGGHGLNLTSAEYVFILDPWWNPAVEAQAVDRAHRIGQTKPVFAYRIIARDTVEEKILELQKSKRKLVDAILDADKSLLQTLTAEDLQLLLS